MSDAKPSRFWGTTPRRIKWFVHILVVLLAGSVIAIGFLVFRDFIWKFNATYFANQAGYMEARYFYAHKSPRLLQLAVIDEETAQDTGAIPSNFEMIPAGRKEEDLDVYFFYVSSSGGRAQRITGESYVKGFNHSMRVMFANPERFGLNGEPLPNSAKTNLPPFKPVPE